MRCRYGCISEAATPACRHACKYREGTHARCQRAARLETGARASAHRDRGLDSVRWGWYRFMNTVCVSVWLMQTDCGMHRKTKILRTCTTYIGSYGRDCTVHQRYLSNVYLRAVVPKPTPSGKRLRDQLTIKTLPGDRRAKNRSRVRRGRGGFFSSAQRVLFSKICFQVHNSAHTRGATKERPACGNYDTILGKK